MKTTQLVALAIAGIVLIAGVGGCDSDDGYCGNGIIDQNFEQCDDGNLFDGDGCTATCQLQPGFRAGFATGAYCASGRQLTCGGTDVVSGVGSTHAFYAHRAQRVRAVARTLGLGTIAPVCVMQGTLAGTCASGCIDVNGVFQAVPGQVYYIQVMPGSPYSAGQPQQVSLQCGLYGF